MSETVRLGTEPTSVREAREIVKEAIARAHWEGDEEAAVLLVSELVTNALRHAGSLTHLDVTVDCDCLHVEASDPRTEAPSVRQVDPAATSGRGMALVEALANDWGVRRDDSRGKTVWFEMVQH